MKKIKWYIIGIIILISILLITLLIKNNKISTISGTIIEVESEYFTLESDNNDIYSFDYLDNDKLEENDEIKIEYKGNLNKNKINKIHSYSLIESTASVLDEIDRNGIFGPFYDMANDKLKTLTLDEKIGQLLLVRVPDNNAVEEINKYQFGGYILFARDFENKTKEQIVNETSSYQGASKIPMILGTDEEGGTVVRASSNSKLIESPFLSSQDLYKKGGFDLIAEDTKNKSRFLSSLGINVNLAPVADVSTNPDDYMYKRAFGQDTNLTSEYVKTVIEASKGEGVSYTLKHFPGYGNNDDTHTGSVVDDRTYEEIMQNDIPPFEAGINASAEAVLVSHNIVTNIEADVPASLSKNVHKLLRETLNFEGVIISDDMDMGAITNGSYGDIYVKAIDAGNDLIIVTDYETAFNQIKDAVNNSTLSENTIDKSVLRILAWKYYKQLFPMK